jgi:heat shock protein HtpX
MLVIAVIIAGVIGFFAELTFRMLFHAGRWSSRGSSSSRKGGGAALAIVIAVALIALAWFLSIVIRFSLSRKREFLADAGAAELTKNPDAMITALRKIEGRGELVGATSGVMEMCVDNPRQGFVDLFATHPPIDRRIEALVNFAGGHDPGPLALPAPEDSGGADPAEPVGPWGEAAPSEPPAGPWGEASSSGEPPGHFLPDRPPVELGPPAPPGSPASPAEPPGPWSPRREN